MAASEGTMRPKKHKTAGPGDLFRAQLAKQFRRHQARAEAPLRHRARDRTLKAGGHPGRCCPADW